MEDKESEIFINLLSWSKELSKTVKATKIVAQKFVIEVLLKSSTYKWVLMIDWLHFIN